MDRVGFKLDTVTVEVLAVLPASSSVRVRLMVKSIRISVKY